MMTVLCSYWAIRTSWQGFSGSPSAYSGKRSERDTLAGPGLTVELPAGVLFPEGLLYSWLLGDECSGPSCTPFPAVRTPLWDALQSSVHRPLSQGSQIFTGE